MFVGLRHTVILRSSLSDVSADARRPSSFMFTLGVETIRVDAIYRLVCTRARRIDNLEYYSKIAK